MRPWGQAVLPRQALLKCGWQAICLAVWVAPSPHPSTASRPPPPPSAVFRSQSLLGRDQAGGRCSSQVVHREASWSHSGALGSARTFPSWEPEAQFSPLLTPSISAVTGRRGDDVPGASRFLLQRRLPVRGDSQPGPVPQQHLPQHASLHGGHSAVQRWVCRGAEPPPPPPRLGDTSSPSSSIAALPPPEMPTPLLTLGPTAWPGWGGPVLTHVAFPHQLYTCVM